MPAPSLPPPLATPLLATLLLATLLPAHAADAVDCLPTPDAPCVVQAPRLLPAPVSALTMPSGTRVAVVPTPASGRVALELRVRPPGGVRTEDQAIAWLLARHLGAEGAASRRLARAKLGAVERVVSVPDGFAIQVEGPASALEALLDLEAERLRAMAPADEEVRRALAGVVADRLRELSSPDAQLLELVRPRPDLADLPALAQVRDRVALAWRGTALTLVIAGDVDPPAASGAAERAFALLPSPVDVEPLAPIPLLPSVDEAWSGSAAAPRVAVAWQGTPTSPGSREHAVRSVLAELLVAPGSPLAARLIDTGLASRLWSAPVPDGVVIAAELAPRVHPGVALAAVDAAAADLLSVDSAELEARMEAARIHLARRAMLALRRPADWATAVAEVMATGAPPGAVDDAVDQLRRVDEPALRAEADALLRVGARREATLLPARAADGVAP